jgi:fatty-acyl-CoA synthase
VTFPQRNLRWTWQELDRQVQRAAKSLVALGIRPGQHVAIWATNIPEWIVLQFATARLGAVMVTVNPAYRIFELEYVLRQSDAVALFLVDRFKASDYFDMMTQLPGGPSADASAKRGSAPLPHLQHRVALRGNPPPGIDSWSDVLSARRSVSDTQLRRYAAGQRDTDAINIQYTSGTTGFPKAATLSHRNVLLNAFYVGTCQRLTQHDRICIPVPFYHCFGCVLGTLTAVVHGATMVIPAEYFTARSVLNAIEQEKATAVYGVPTMFVAELADPHFDQRDLSSLRTGIMAGSPCPEEIMRQVMERMGADEITIAYGQTETSPVITQTRTDDPLQLRVQTVGRPLPGVEVRIVSPTKHEPCDVGQPGEICCRGHGVMLGYYNQPGATEAVVDADGWLHTGDLGQQLPNGYYQITGRIRDLVIRGGENVYPREIEECLLHHPAVEQSAVVGIPDPRFGEELCAWVKLKSGFKLTTDQLRKFCQQRIAHYKVPKYIKFVDAFPLTATGKIQKYKIRQQMRRELDPS